MQMWALKQMETPCKNLIQGFGLKWEVLKEANDQIVGLLLDKMNRLKVQYYK